MTSASDQNAQMARLASKVLYELSSNIRSLFFLLIRSYNQTCVLNVFVYIYETDTIIEGMVTNFISK